jgi:DNA-directed RNA polymerase subunit RPC12/RpoP
MKTEKERLKSKILNQMMIWECDRCGDRFKRKVNYEKHLKNSFACKPIPKGQKRKLMVCPHCGFKTYYWQYANNHAHKMKHWGCYISR